MGVFGLFYNRGFTPKFPEQNIDFTRQKHHFLHPATPENWSVPEVSPDPKIGTFFEVIIPFQPGFGDRKWGSMRPVKHPYFSRYSRNKTLILHPQKHRKWTRGPRQTHQIWHFVKKWPFSMLSSVFTRFFVAKMRFFTSC